MWPPESRKASLAVLHRAAGRAALGVVLADLGRPIDSAVAIAYSRDRCLIGRVAGTRIIDSHGNDTTDDSSMFEVRVFTRELELRWYSDPTAGDGGDAVIITENASLLTPEWQLVQQFDDLIACANQYLLWGTAEQPGRDGWTTLSAQRIGAVDVPIELGEDTRAVLKTIEYIGIDPLPDDLAQHGNTTVIDERLCQLALFDPSRTHNEPTES